MKITFQEDPKAFLAGVRGFLAAQPILHNLVLSILQARIDHPEPGRYWAAMEGDKTRGVVLQSPADYPATLGPMDPEVATAMVDAIVDQGVLLPGVNGPAAAAAAFAGHWSERTSRPAVPFQANRIYELMELAEEPEVRGKLRRGIREDQALLVAWANAFQAETMEVAYDTELYVSRWLAAGQAWIWEDGEPVSMAVSRTATEGVVRVSGVYTPPDKRKRGYAQACVHALSRFHRDAGSRCMLYTDLGNATSNSVYRRIGYRAVAEVLRYRFE